MPKIHLGSTAQEALCRHLTMADVYIGAGRSDQFVQLLSEDIDVKGVDLTLIHEGHVVPVQLKSRIGSTSQWWVRRRIVVPEFNSAVHNHLFDHQDVATEGLGGALLVQDLHLTVDGARLWYRLGRLDLIFLRNPKRFAKLAQAMEACPDDLVLSSKDLTPPLTMGDVLWLLFGFGSDMADEHGLIEPGAALISVDDGGKTAQAALQHLEALARARYRAWKKAQPAALHG